MDPHNPAPTPPVEGQELNPSTTSQPATPAVITSPPTALASTAITNVGAPIDISPPSPPTTPIAMTSVAGGSGPWPRPATPSPGPTLPDRVFSCDGAGTPPHTPILGSSAPQQPFSSYPVANNHSGQPSHSLDGDPPGQPANIFEPQSNNSGATHPVLRLRHGHRELDGDAEKLASMASLDEIVDSGGFETGDTADEDFYADTDDGSRSEASSFSSLWASRAYLDRGNGDVGQSVQIGRHDHEHRGSNGNNSRAGKRNEKGKQRADDCGYYDPDIDPHRDGYFSESETATGDEAPRRAAPFVPSFHDSQAAPVKRGSFVFRNGYGGEDWDVHERGGDVEGEASVPAGCELEYPLAPGVGENHGNNEGARFAPPGPEREIHRLPPSALVCIRRPPGTTVLCRGRGRHRTHSPEFIPDPSVIQLLAPQGTISAQFNNVADVQVTTEMRLLGEGYGLREIVSNGGCDEIRRGWGGVRGCVVEFKGGDKWELDLKERAVNSNTDGKKRRHSPSGVYDGDDEGTIGAASDAEDAVAQLNAQPTSRDFILGPSDMKPYILDVVDDDPNKTVSRYTDVADYSVHLQRAGEGSSFAVRVRDMRGSLVIMWKRVARVEIVLVRGVAVDINAGDGKESENGDREVVVGDVGLRGGADKGKGPGSGQGGGDSENSRHGDSSREVGSLREGSSSSSDVESGEKTPKRKPKDKGKGRAVDDGDATPRNQYGSDSENHGSIPLCYETPAEYVKTVGLPHRVENPEPDYVLGSCPCLDRPIAYANTNADPPQCTCIRPASPEPSAPATAPEPWAVGYFSSRYQEFLRSGPSSEPYGHSCTADSESHGEWITEAREKLEDDIANQALSSGIAAGVAPPDKASSSVKPLDGSLGEDTSKGQHDGAVEEQIKDQSNPAPVSGPDGQSEAARPEDSQNNPLAHSRQPHNVEHEGNSSTNVDREASTGHATEENTAERNTTRREEPQAYTNRHAPGFHSFQGPLHLPPLYPPHPLPSLFHPPVQPTITTIHFFPPLEFPSIYYQHPIPPLHAPFTHHNPFIPHSQNAPPHHYPQTLHQPISTFPEIPESNYFYPDGRSARLRFPTPPDQAAGQEQLSSSHEHAPGAGSQNSARITQATALQPALPGSSPRENHAQVIEEQMVTLIGAFELLRDMHLDLAQRLDSGR